MSIFTRTALALSAAAAMWFAVQAAVSAFTRREMSRLDRRLADIEAERVHKGRKTLRERISEALATQGYEGGLAPVVGVAVLAWLSLVVMASLAGLAGASAYLGSVLVLVAAVASTMWRAARVRTRLFEEQLLQALQLLPGILETGRNITHALEHLVGSLEDPFRSEIAAALRQTVAGGSLVKALREVYTRYPSPSLRLMLAALEADEAGVGGSLAPALRRAAEMLQRDVTLRHETNAELSNMRFQFKVMTAVIAFIAYMVLANGGADATKALLGFPGVILTIVATANFALGYWRGQRIFSKAGGNR